MKKHTYETLAKRRRLEHTTQLIRELPTASPLCAHCNKVPTQRREALEVSTSGGVRCKLTVRTCLVRMIHSRIPYTRKQKKIQTIHSTTNTISLRCGHRTHDIACALVQRCRMQDLQMRNCGQNSAVPNMCRTSEMHRRAKLCVRVGESTVETRPSTDKFRVILDNGPSHSRTSHAVRTTNKNDRDHDQQQKRKITKKKNIICTSEHHRDTQT